jgi:hypothetical protein
MTPSKRKSIAALRPPLARLAGAAPPDSVVDSRRDQPLRLWIEIQAGIGSWPSEWSPGASSFADRSGSNRRVRNSFRTAAGPPAAAARR